jgi:hypothetical protein
MDSFGICELFTRVFVSPEQFRATVAFYKALTGGRVTLHFAFPERGLELASISSPTASFLVIAGTEPALTPFRSTAVTVVVSDIMAIFKNLPPLGATVLQEPTPVPTGYQMRLRHPDGVVVEYVQHTSAADRFRNPEL